MADNTTPKFTDATARPDAQAERAKRIAKDERRRKAASKDARFDRGIEAFIDDVEARSAERIAEAEAAAEVETLAILDELAADAAAKRDRFIREAQLFPSGSERAERQERARAAHSRAQQWRSMEANLRTQVRVSEPSPYGEGSPHSYFRDLVAAVSPVPVAGKADAEERLRRHGRDVQTRAAGGTAAARRAVRDLVRRDTPAEAEYRAMTTGTGSGLAFVTPAYLLDQWAKWRSYVPAVADACRNVELPEYGMEINVPAVLSGPDAVAIQATENSSVGETNLTAGYRTAAVETFAGSTTVSQQLFDRAGPASTT